MLSPRAEWGGDRHPLVLNTQPALIWRGELGRVELADESTGRIVWSQRVMDKGPLLLSGATLVPGRQYTWLAYDANDLLVHAMAFQVLGGEMRQRMLSLLAERRSEKRSAEPSASESEIQAWERVRHLSQNQLWADVLQEAYRMERPSPSLSRFRQDLEQSLCGDRPPRFSRPLSRALVRSALTKP
ncbi:MAG: hypothetical protein HC918_09750 [Oscillatoriales cyanobacterium SM2_1_8]|nr:hypothetical protein [Oscillatoriales cyanobacterium SM2_1_8]